jgi:hypothetical protein
MQKPLTAILAVSIGVLGAATPASAGLLSATGKVIAILAGELFVGEAEGHLSGAGTLSIHSQGRPDLTCAGDFTSSSVTKQGAGKLQCSDGNTSTFEFQRLSLRSGHGTGTLKKGSMSFSYGLTPDEARPYLKLPKGKKLVQDGEKLELVDAAAAAPHK